MAPEDSHALEPLSTEGVARILVVVAHPDDAEYGTSAAVAAWTSRGIDVAYLLLTAGETGMQRPPHEAGPLRRAEQRAACREVGVDRLTILDHPDGILEYGLGLRRDIAREVRTFRPDALVCGGGDLAVPWGVDHPDHRAAGLAAIDAVRDAANRWVFPELGQDEGLDPWETTWLWLTTGEPSHYAEVSEAEEARAVASLAAHRAYLADLPWHEAPDTFVPGLLSTGAERAQAPDVSRAVAFQVRRLRE